MVDHPVMKISASSGIRRLITVFKEARPEQREFSPHPYTLIIRDSL